MAVAAPALEAVVEWFRIRHLPLKLTISDPYRSYRIACQIRSGAHPYQEDVFCHIAQLVAGQIDRPGLPWFVLPLSPSLSYLSAPDSLRHLRYDCLLETAQEGLVALAHPVPCLVDRVVCRPLEVAVVSLVVAAHSHRFRHPGCLPAPYDYEPAETPAIAVLIAVLVKQGRPGLESDLQVPLLAQPEL